MLTSCKWTVLIRQSCSYYVCLNLLKPFAFTPCHIQEDLHHQAIYVKFVSLTANILPQVILCTWKSKTIWIRIWRIYIQKKSGFVTLANAVTYLKMLSTTQDCSMANRKCVKYNWRFYFCPCYWQKPASPSAKPPTTHSFLLAISFNTLTRKLMQLS